MTHKEAEEVPVNSVFQKYTKNNIKQHYLQQKRRILSRTYVSYNYDFPMPAEAGNCNRILDAFFGIFERFRVGIWHLFGIFLHFFKHLFGMFLHLAFF